MENGHTWIRHNDQPDPFRMPTALLGSFQKPPGRGNRRAQPPNRYAIFGSAETTDTVQPFSLAPRTWVRAHLRRWDKISSVGTHRLRPSERAVLPALRSG